MARHEVIHIVNGVKCVSVAGAESLVGLLGLAAACKQEDFVGVGQALQVLTVPLERLEDLLGQLGI